MPSFGDLREVFSRGEGSNNSRRGISPNRGRGGRREEHFIEDDDDDDQCPLPQQEQQHHQHQQQHHHNHHERPPRHSPQQQQHAIPLQSFSYDSGRQQYRHSHAGHHSSSVPSDESASASPPHGVRLIRKNQSSSPTEQQQRTDPYYAAARANNNSKSSTNTPSPQSWDGDRQFPLLEIQRIKKKTKKLRKGHTQAIFRSSHSNSSDNEKEGEEEQHDMDDEKEDDDDDDGFEHGEGGVAAFSVHVQRDGRSGAYGYSDHHHHHHHPTGGVETTEYGGKESPLTGIHSSIGRIKKKSTRSHTLLAAGHRTWSSGNDSPGSRQQQQQQQQQQPHPYHDNHHHHHRDDAGSHDSLAEVLDETEEPSETSSRSFSVRRRGSGNEEETVETPSCSSSEAVRKAEQELMESFRKPARRGRSTSRGRSTTGTARTSTSRATTVTSVSTTASSSRQQQRQGGADGQSHPSRSPTPKPRRNHQQHYEEGYEGHDYYEKLVNTTDDLDVSNESAESSAAAADRRSPRESPRLHHHSNTTNQRSSGGHASLNTSLHDLCGEAIDQNDVAWRNALYLLSVQPELARVVDDGSSSSGDGSSNGTGGGGWTALHISCMGQEPPPTFMIRALLYSYAKAAQIPDAGGRYPLHLVAASSGDAETMRLLVHEYPQAIHKMDQYGMTPLHLLIRNTAVELMVGNVQVLLQSAHGLEAPGSKNKNNNDLNRHLLQRRGEHLNLRLEELHRLRQSQRQEPVTVFHRYNNDYYDDKDEFDKKHAINDEDDAFEAEFDQYPPDVQVSLRRMAQWKRHKKRKGEKRRHWARKGKQLHIDGSDDQDDDHDNVVPLEYENSDYYYYYKGDAGPVDYDDGNDDAASVIRLRETNPAAIPTPGDITELPLHMIVRRGLVEQTPLDIYGFRSSSLSYRSKKSTNIHDADVEHGSSSSVDDDDDDDMEVKSSPSAPRPSIPNVFEVIRTVIAAYPPALAFRDGEGLTPLLTVMLLQDSLPSLDVIELLLGKRSIGYRAIPSWARDMPLHRFLSESASSSSASNAILENPAMVPTIDTKQLPLHVAAEELLSDVSLVQTIYEAYPAAVKVQDNRGRTPLHLALRSYRRIPPNPQVISILFRDSAVAQIRDDDGNLPFDLLVDSSVNFPLTMPKSWEASSLDKYAPEGGSTDAATVYSKFFHASILGAARPNNKRETKYFLERIRHLPTWLRRQACATSFVQDLLVEELSSPWKCAVIVLDGLLLALLLIVFRMQMKEFIESREATDVRRSSLYTYLVYTTAASRLVIQGVFCALVGGLGQFRHLVLANGWWWVDYSAMGLSMVTSVLLNGSLDDNILLILSTVVTALLWLTALGYLSHWSYGTAVFMGILGKIARCMFWPMATLALVVIGGAQMFSTLLHVDGNCANAMGDAVPVCTARDAYRVIYLLLFFNNDALIDTSGVSPMSTEAMVLVAVLVGILVFVMLGLLVMAVLTALDSDVHGIALESYWEPKMAFVLSAYDVGGFFCCYQVGETGQGRYSLQRFSSCEERYTKRLAQAWDLLMMSFSPTSPSYSIQPAADGAATPDRQDKLWYAKTAQVVASSRQGGPCSSLQAIWAWPLWIASIVLVPLWLLVGLLTLGLLWPPQVRCWLFQSKSSYSTARGQHGRSANVGDTAEYTSMQLSNMRTEMNDIKTMSHEQSGNIEREIRELKELLYLAMKEE